MHTQHDTIDPGAVGLSNLAWAEALLANDEEAKDLLTSAITLASEIKHPYSLAYSLCLGGAVHQCLNEPEQTLTLVDQALSIASKNEYLYWTAWGSALRGWALTKLKQSAHGLELLEAGKTQYEATGARLFLPHILSIQAEALISCDQIESARVLLENAVTVAADNDICFYSSETYRLLAIANDKLTFHEEASRLFAQAAALATQQGALAFKRHIDASIKSRSSNVDLS